MSAEFTGRFRRAVIVLAQGADPAELAIDVGFVGANVANDLAEFGDPVDVFRLLEPWGIDHESLPGKLDQDAGRPAAKDRGLRG